MLHGKSEPDVAMWSSGPLDFVGKSAYGGKNEAVGWDGGVSAVKQFVKAQTGVIAPPPPSAPPGAVFIQTLG